MEEFVTSETEYVSNLDHVIHGYLVQCESNPGLFPDKLIANIFSNIRAIHDLHVRFLRRMKRAVRQNSISAIGRLFLSNQKSFEIYREYCFNFDSANTQVNSLLVQQEYTSFFNCCRTKDLRLVIKLVPVYNDSFCATYIKMRIWRQRAGSLKTRTYVICIRSCGR